jgi:hypothetical protein
MGRFAHAAVFAVAISAPVLAGALIDHSVVSVLGAPTGGTGPCKSICQVGGANEPALGTGNGGTSSGGQAQGGIVTASGFTAAGTIPVTGGQTTGREVLTGRTFSGNFTNLSAPKGHCTSNGMTVACP